MKQIKPGRVPSLMGSIGSILVIIFGIFWTVFAASTDAPAFLPLFGIVFVLVSIGQAIYQYKNAFGKRRISEYDIVVPTEESDVRLDEQKSRSGDLNYCSYYGSSVDKSFSFRPSCGKKLIT